MPKRTDQATPVVIFSKGPWRIKSRWYTHYRCDHPEQDLHPWQKVQDDMAHWVESFTEPGDLVCDPLAGSFTAAAACEKLARRFVGCDQEKRNVLIGQRRLREIQRFGILPAAHAYQGQQRVAGRELVAFRRAHELKLVDAHIGIQPAMLLGSCAAGERPRPPGRCTWSNRA